jgi:hypothetical protein
MLSCGRNGGRIGFSFGTDSHSRSKFTLSASVQQAAEAAQISGISGISGI